MTKACRKGAPKPAAEGKRGRGPARAPLPAAPEAPRRLDLQPSRTLRENLADLPRGCDWGGKRNSKGKTEHWRGYKLHLSTGDGGVILAAALTSASVHDSQAAIPLMQMTAERATVLYDLADSAYDAQAIRDFSRSLGRVPVIDPNPRRKAAEPLSPAERQRYRERSTVERSNSDLKDSYGARQVRVKGHVKVFCHLMLAVVALTVRQLLNMLC